MLLKGQKDRLGDDRFTHGRGFDHEDAVTQIGGLAVIFGELLDFQFDIADALD